MEFTTAIIKVLTTTRKREVKEEIKLIESKGYEVYKTGEKNAEGMAIRNYKTNKTIWLSSHYSYKNNGYFYYLNYYTRRYSKSAKFNSLDKLKDTFNFEDYFNTPYNREFKDDCGWYSEQSVSQMKYDSLKSKRRDVEYHQKEIERAKAELEKQIAKLQKEILYHTEKLAESKSNLSEFKKELGLTK